MCGVSRKSYPNFFKVADKIWTLRIFFQSCQQIKQQSVQMHVSLNFIRLLKSFSPLSNV